MVEPPFAVSSPGLGEIALVSVAVFHRYGLPPKLKWNIPLKRAEDFNRWLALWRPQPR